MSIPFFPIDIPALDSIGKFVDLWRRYFEGISSSITTLTSEINAVPGVNYFTIATQPSLGPGDAGYVGFETDTGHYVYFDGTNWQLLGSGDAPGRIEDFAVAPTFGWQLCDGTATNYLVVGAPTLSVTSFTTPDLSGTPSYRKSGAAYTGTVNAKVAPTSTGTGTTGTGTTGTGTTGTGTTGNESSHTHGTPIVSVVPDGGGIKFLDTGSGISLLTSAGSTGPGSAHNHSVPGLSVPGLSVPGLSVPALSIGTIEMANIVMLPYFRR